MYKSHGQQGLHWTEVVGSWSVHVYNCHSFMSEYPTELVLEKLADVIWDVIVFVETWREDESETSCIECGTLKHTFYGNICRKGSRGVTFS